MIEINNLTEVEIDEDRVRRAISTATDKDVSLAFIGPGRMRKLNKKYRSKNRVTDVLSFPESEVEFKKFVIGGLKKTDALGEIVVCLREVKKNSRESSSFEQELDKVLIHGTLHLLGYDHEKDSGEMKAKQEQCLSQLSQQ